MIAIFIVFGCQRSGGFGRVLAKSSRALASALASVGSCMLSLGRLAQLASSPMKINPITVFIASAYLH